MAGVLWLSLLLCASSYWVYSPNEIEQIRNTEVQPLNAGESAAYTFSIRNTHFPLTFILTVEFPRVSYAPSALAAVTCVVNAQPAACKSVDSKVLITVPAGSGNREDFTVVISGVINPAVYPKGTGIFRAWTSLAEQALPWEADYALDAVGLMPAASQANCYDALHVQTTEVQEKTAISFTITQLVDVPAGSLVQITFPAEFTLQQGALPCTIWGKQVDCSASGQVVEAVGTPFPISQENAASNYLNVTIWGVTNPAYALPPKALSFAVKVWDARHRYIYSKCSALSGNITAGTVNIYEANYALDVVQPIYGGWSVVDITFVGRHSIPANGYLYVRLNNPVYNEWYDTTPTSDIGAAPKTTIDYCCVKLGISNCQANCHRMRTDLEQYHYELLIDGSNVDLKPDNITLRVMMELWYEPVVAEIQSRTKDHRVVDSTFITPNLAIPQVSASAFSSDSFINRLNNYLSFDGSIPKSGSEYSKFQFSFTSSALLKTNTRVTATLNTASSNFSPTGPPESCTGSFVSGSPITDANMCGILNGNQLYISFPANMIAGANSITWDFGSFYKLRTPLMATGQCIFHIVHIEMTDENGNVIYQTNYPLFLYTKFMRDPYRVVAGWNADSVTSGNGKLTQWRLKFKPTIAVPYSQGTGNSKIRFTCDDTYIKGIQDVRGNAVTLGSKVQGFAFLGYTDTTQVSIVLDKGTVNHADGNKPASGFSFTVTTPEMLKTETCYELSVLAGGPVFTGEETIKCSAEYSYTIGCEDYKVETHSSVSTTTIIGGNSLSYRSGLATKNTWDDLSVYLQSSTAVSSLTNITLKGSLSGSNLDNPAWMSCWLPSSWRFTANSTMLLDGYILGNVTVVNDWATVISGRTWGDATLNNGENSYVTLSNVMTPACAADGGTQDPIACYYGTYSKPSSGYKSLSNALKVNQFRKVLDVAISPEWGTQGQTDAAYNVSFSLEYSIQAGAQILVRISSHLGDTGLYPTPQGMCTVNVPATCTYANRVFNVTLQDNTAARDTLIVGFSGVHNPIISPTKAACDTVIITSIKVVDHCVNSYTGQALNIPGICLLQPNKPANLEIISVEIIPAFPELVPAEVEINFKVSPALRPGTRLNFTFPTGSIKYTSCGLMGDTSAQCVQVAPNMVEITTIQYLSEDILVFQYLTSSSAFSSEPFTLTATYAGSAFTSYRYYRPLQGTTFTPKSTISFSKQAGAVQSTISNDFSIKVWPTRTEGEIVTMTFAFTPRVALVLQYNIWIVFPAAYGRAALSTPVENANRIPCESPSLQIRYCMMHMRMLLARVENDKVFTPFVEHVLTVRNLRNPPATGASTGPFQIFITSRNDHELLLTYDQSYPLGEYFFQAQPQAIIFNPVPLADLQGRLVSPERSMNFTIAASNYYVRQTANYTFEFSANHAYNFSIVGSASCVGVQFPRDYELNNFVEALLPLPEIVVPDSKSDFNRDLLPLACLLTIWGNSSYWATCHYYQNHVFLLQPPKGLQQIAIHSIRNPTTVGQTSAFVLKIYENFYNDYSVNQYDAGGRDTNITFQTYPSLNDYTLTFSGNPTGYPHLGNKEEIQALASSVSINPGTQVPCALRTYSGMSNFIEKLTFRPIVLGSNMLPTDQVTLKTPTWVWKYFDFRLNFDIVISPDAPQDTYTVYWLMQEDAWSDTSTFESPMFESKAKSRYNHTGLYLPPAPLRINVNSNSLATIGVVGEIGTMAPGSVRGHIKLMASTAPSAPLTVSFKPNTAGVTVSPATVVFAAGDMYTEIEVSVAASETMTSALVSIDLSGASAAAYTATPFSFTIKQVRDAEYSAKVTILEKHKTWVNFGIASEVGGVLGWVVAAEGTPAPLAAEIMTGAQSFSTTSSYTSHLSDMAYGQTALMVETQLKVDNLRSETRYVLYTYVQTDKGTVGPLGQYLFSTLNNEKPVLVRLTLSRQPTDAEYSNAISSVYYLTKAPGSRVNYATTWGVDSTTNTNYADIQITSSSRWEDAIAPILLVQHIRIDTFISFNGVSTDFIQNVQLLQPTTFAPQFVEAPTVRSVQTGAIILEAVLETGGAVYAVAVEAGDLPPTSLQVVNGLDARNMPTASSRATTAGQVKVIWSVSDLPENVYDIYVTTEDLMPKYPIRSQVVEKVHSVQVAKGVYTAQAFNQVNGNVTDLVPEEELEGAVGMVMTGVLLFLLN